MQKFLRTLMLVALMIVPFASQAQVGTYLFSTGVDNTHWYTLTSDSTMLLDALSFTTSTTASTGDSKRTDVANIGFTFNFGGVDYTQFSANSDGTVRLGSTQIVTSGYSSPFGTNASSNTPKICGLGCDGCMVAGDYIAYQLFGTEGNRVAVIEISTGTFTSSTRGNHYTFQVQLAEADGSVTLMYSPTAPAAGPATTYQIGASTSNTDIVLFDVTNNTMTAYSASTTTNNASGTWPAAGRYYTIAPDPDACYSVANLTATNILVDGFTLTWDDAANASSTTYTIYDLADTSVVVSGLTATTYTVTGLTDNTSYNYAVVANCSATNESNPVTISVHTACAALNSLPVTWTFETGELQGTTNLLSLPWCFERYNNSTSTSYNYYPYAYNYSSYAYGGSSRSMYFYGSASYGADTMALIFPELNVTTYPMNGNRVKFFARGSSTSYTKNLYVGTMSDPTDISTFTLADTVAITGTTYAQYSISLDNAPATDAYVVMIAFKGNGNIYVDDVTLEVKPACMDVAGVTVSATTSSSVTLTWTDAQNPAGTTYTIYNMSDTTAVLTNVTSTTGTITGLDANTPYTFGVQANCTAGDAPIYSIDARTACGAINSLPYTMGFEQDEIRAISPSLDAMPWCWTRINNTVGTSYNYYPYSYSSSSYAHTGSRSFYFYAYDASWFTGGDTTGFIMPELNVTTYPMNTTRVSFWAKVASTTDFVVHVGTMSDPDDLSTFTEVSSVVVTGTDYAKYTVSLATATATDGYVAFIVPRVYSSMYMDDLTLEELPNCLEISDLTAGNITDNSITLTWVDAQNATYTVYDMSDTSVVATGITGTTYTATGLTSNTEYTFGVVANCSATDASPVVTVSGKTLCSALTLPYAETFDSYTTTATSSTAPTGYPNVAMPDCWTIVNMSANTSSYPQAFLTSYSSYAVSGNCLFFKSSSATRLYAILPAFEAPTANQEITFSYRNEGTSASNGIIIVGMMGGDDVFVPIDTLERITTVTEHTTILPVAMFANGARVAFCYAGGTSNNYYASIDNVNVHAAPSCLAPTALAASAITDNGATLTWNGEATSYNVYAIAAETATLVQNVTAATITLTGLTANTEYTYGVTSVCGTDESDMVSVTFRTACNAVALPFTESFEATSATVDCWEFVATANVGGSNGMGIVTLNGNSVLRFSSYSSATDYNQYAYSPVLDATTLTGADSMHVRVRYATYGSNDELSFGYVTSDGTVNWNPATFTTTGQSDFQVFEANLPLTTAKLAVHYYGNYSWYAWVDSVEVTGYTAAPQTANITFAVNDATMGTTNPAPGTYNYNIGENYTVTAQPNAGYHFANWTFTQDTAVTMLQVTDTALEFTMYAALDGGILTAVFAADSTPVPPVDSIYITLAVNDATMGTTVPAPGTHAYVAGETFTATAVPETGYHLTDWQMTLGGQVIPTGVSDLTITDVITSDYNGVTITAVFAEDAVGCAPVALPYTETFEATSATVDCWTTDGPGTWNFGSYSSTGVTYEGSNYAYIRHATSGNVTKLISPVLSASADATALQLTFAHIQKSWSGDQDEMRVYYRTSATDSWVMAAEYTTDIQNWTVENIVIPANTHQVAFEMTDGWGYGVAVDSVVVSEMTAAYCYAVTGLTATPTAYDVALTWNDANNDGATYTIYSATGDVIATGVTGNNYTVTNLTPDSPYTFGVVANCTATSASEVATVTTRTLVTCPAPTALTATIIPGNGTQTTLAWTAGATETAWQICLNGDSTNLIDVTTNPYTLTGLTPETPYTAMVRANCDVNDQSAWSNTVNFTPTNAYIVTVNDGATTNNTVPIYGLWADDITKSQFIIPAADLAAMQYGAVNKLTFYASQASVSWGAAEFNVYVTETTDSILTALADYTTMTQVYAGTLSINNNIMEVNFTNPYLYMGGNLLIGFLQTVSGSYVSSTWYGVDAPQGASWGGYGSSVSAKAFLPKTTIAYTPGTAPSCLPVTGLTVSDVTATGATLTWNGDAASYNVYAISATDTTLVQNVATTTITLAGLTAMTHYTYGVTAVCTNDESIMMITTFTTACAAVAIPFTEGFEGNSNTLACWSVYATSNNTGIATSATTYAHTGDGVFAFAYSTNPPQFLISPELSGTGSQLQVEFDYRIMTSSYPESFVLGYSTTTADTSAFTWGTEQTNLLNETYAHYTEVLNASGIKYVAVKYTANDMYYLFIDDVVIRDVPACAAVTNLTVDSVTMTSVSLSWTDANNTGATYTVYNDSTVVATGITTTNYTVTGLTAATTYTFGVVANCSATEAGDMVTIVASTACGDIATLPYYEGFENGFGCWSTVNGSADGQPWNVQTSFSDGSVTPHTGNYMAASWSWNSSAMHADAWLISPKFVLPATLPAGEELTLSWWERTNSSYPDSYSVVLSTTTNDTAAFTTVLRPYDEAEGSWTLQSVDLTAYAGQSIYIAFHHMDYDENYLLIDDIELSLNAPVVPADTLTVTFAVNDATMGTTTPAPGTYTYVSGDTISFTATANSGYHFDYWLLTYMGETDTMPINSWSFEADDLLVDGVDNLVMQAVFSAGTPDSIAVTYAVNDATMGTTTPAPGVHYYYVNDLVSVTATPNAGYMLDHWFLEMFVGGQPYMSDTIDAEENPLLIMVVDQQYADYNVTFTVTAYFAADTTPVTMYNVTLGVNDTTMGSVNPAGTTQVAEGSNFIATATANSGYHFVAWLNQTGDTVSRINIYSFTVTSDVTLMAVFAENDSSLNYYTVSVAYDNSKGRIDGEGSYEEGSSVSLIAYPFENYEFVAWLDENMDTLSTNTAYMIVNLQSNRALTAIFRPKNSINDVEADNVTVYSVDNRIVVRGAEGRQVFLFDVNGRMLSREASATENVEFRVNNSGVYLVKVGNAAAKRVVVLR